MKFGTIFLAGLFISTPVWAAERAVAVVGSCIKNVVPDRASLRITSDILDKNVTLASKRATETYEKVRDEVRKLQLADSELETVEYSVQEVKEWTSRTYVSKGFRARLGLLVSTSDIKRMGEVIAIASKYGVKDTGQLATFLSEFKTKQEREACLEEAIKNARSKAQKMAQAAGAKVGRVLSLSEKTSSDSPVAPFYRSKRLGREGMAEMAGDSPAPEIETRGETMSVEVLASFELD